MNHFDITTVQKRAWSILARSFAARKVASTYLLCGPEGLGHWPLAIAYAALLNCEKPESTSESKAIPKACGECDACRTVFALNSPALHLIVPIPTHRNLSEAIDLTNAVLEEKRKDPLAAASSTTSVSISVEMAREVKARLSRKTEAGMTRVVLFYQMERMLPASADALLKLIEEPPSNTVLLLTAVRPEALLPTIQSRSQKIRLERWPNAAVQEYLCKRFELDETIAEHLARIAEGNISAAITLAQAREEIGSNRAVGFLLFKGLLLDRNPAAVIHVVDLLNGNDRGAAEGLLTLWLSLIRDCQYYAETGDSSRIVNADFSGDVMLFARHFEDAHVTGAVVTRIKNTLADLRRNVHIPAALVALTLGVKSDLGTSGQA